MALPQKLQSLDLYSDAINIILNKMQELNIDHQCCIKFSLGTVIKNDHDIFHSERHQHQTVFCENIGDDFMQKIIEKFKNNRIVDTSLNKIKYDTVTQNPILFYFKHSPFDIKIDFTNCFPLKLDDWYFDCGYHTFIVYNVKLNNLNIVVDFHQLKKTSISFIYVLHRCFLIVCDFVEVLECYEENEVTEINPEIKLVCS